MLKLKDNVELKELEKLRGITRNKIEYIKRQPEID